MGQLVYHASGNIDSKWLSDNDFLFNRALSDEKDRVYVHRFVVLRWGLSTTLEAEMQLHMIDQTVTIDVYDGSGYSRGKYAPFYYGADNYFITEIMKSIVRECKKLGIINE